MTTSNDWDCELDSLAQEIKALRLQHKKNRFIGSLVAKKMLVLQKQVNLETLFKRMEQLTNRDYLLLPRERTLLHWGKIYTQKVIQSFLVHHGIVSKSLWISLLQARMSDPKSSFEYERQHNDLVTIAIRLKDLERIEDLLLSQFRELRKKKKELRQAYKKQEVADANHEASSCLASRLGIGVKDAIESPEMKALSLLFQELTAQIYCKKNENVKKAEADFSIQGLSMMKKAKDFVLAAKDATVCWDGGGEGTILSFKEALDELQDLEAKSEAAYAQALQACPQDPRLTILPKTDVLKKTPGMSTALYF